MRIEDNYKDVTIYSVVFKSETHKEINRMLVLNSRYTELEKSKLEQIVLNTFNNVLEILHIEEIMDGLSLKETSPYYVKYETLFPEKELHAIFYAFGTYNNRMLTSSYTEKENNSEAVKAYEGFLQEYSGLSTWLSSDLLKDLATNSD